MQDLYQISPRVHGMARAIIAHEIAQQPEPPSLAIALETVYAKLRVRLGDLVGLTGFTALFERALHLTRREASVMSTISISLDDPMTLHGMPADDLMNGEAASAYALLVAYFIWLLEVFLDVELGTRLIVEIWPHASNASPPHGGTNS